MSCSLFVSHNAASPITPKSPHLCLQVALHARHTHAHPPPKFSIAPDIDSPHQIAQLRLLYHINSPVTFSPRVNGFLSQEPPFSVYTSQVVYPYWPSQSGEPLTAAEGPQAAGRPAGGPQAAGRSAEEGPQAAGRPAEGPQAEGQEWLTFQLFPGRIPSQLIGW